MELRRSVWSDPWRSNGRLQRLGAATGSLDSATGLQVLNVNNLKLARFEEIFPAPAKNDHIDTDKMLELLQLGDTLERARPPAMAGIIAISSPADNGVSRLSRNRMSSSLR